MSPTQTGDKNAPNLKMAEREDWTLFRSVDGLTQKAGVPTTKLRRLVLKELADKNDRPISRELKRALEAHLRSQEGQQQ